MMRPIGSPRRLIARNDLCEVLGLIAGKDRLFGMESDSHWLIAGAGWERLGTDSGRGRRLFRPRTGPALQ